MASFSGQNSTGEHSQEHIKIVQEGKEMKPADKNMNSNNSLQNDILQKEQNTEENDEDEDELEVVSDLDVDEDWFETDDDEEEQEQEESETDDKEDDSTSETESDDVTDEESEEVQSEDEDQDDGEETAQVGADDNTSGDQEGHFWDGWFGGNDDGGDQPGGDEDNNSDDGGGSQEHVGVAEASEAATEQEPLASKEGDPEEDDLEWDTDRDNEPDEEVSPQPPSYPSMRSFLRFFQWRASSPSTDVAQLAQMAASLERAAENQLQGAREDHRYLASGISRTCARLSILREEHAAVQRDLRRDARGKAALDVEKAEVYAQLAHAFEEEVASLDPVLKLTFPFLHAQFHNASTGGAIADLHQQVHAQISVLNKLQTLIKVKEYNITRSKKEKHQFKKRCRELRRKKERKDGETPGREHRRSGSKRRRSSRKRTHTQSPDTTPDRSRPHIPVHSHNPGSTSSTATSSISTSTSTTTGEEDPEISFIRHVTRRSRIPVLIPDWPDYRAAAMSVIDARRRGEISQTLETEI